MTRTTYCFSETQMDISALDVSNISRNLVFKTVAQLTYLNFEYI